MHMLQLWCLCGLPTYSIVQVVPQCMHLHVLWGLCVCRVSKRNTQAVYETRSLFIQARNMDALFHGCISWCDGPLRLLHGSPAKWHAMTAGVTCYAMGAMIALCPACASSAVRGCALAGCCVADLTQLWSLHCLVVFWPLSLLLQSSSQQVMVSATWCDSSRVLQMCNGCIELHAPASS
jgi:hypothetical protein